MSKKTKLSDAHNKILLKYAKLAKSLGKYPSRADLKVAGISRDSMRAAFGDMDNLKALATAEHPESFADILTLEYFSPALYKEQQDIAKSHKTHVVTTAVGGAPVHEEFLASLLNYCDHHNAALWVLVANYALCDVDKALISNPKVNIIFRPIRLNSKCLIDSIKIDSKQVDPATGLDSNFAHDEGTLIIGSPKQRRVPLANAHGKISPVIQATGAVTRPNYTKFNNRRDALAEKQHVMGAIVVEIKDDKIHFPRNVMMSKDGSFNDIAHNYASDDITKITIAAIKPGDWHTGATDPTTRAVIIDVCKLTKPEYLVLEDFADFSSINPHEEESKVIRAMIGVDGLSLDKEMQLNAKELDALRKMKLASKAILITASNHIDFLPRYLNKGKFDDMNRQTATRLQLIAMSGKEPYEHGLRELYGLRPGKDVQFLTVNQEFRVAGVELAVHGHLGANGKRSPGAKGLFKAFGKVSYGHCHHGEIWHGAISSGTSTYMDLGYNSGASNWDRSFQLVHKDGTRQLINIINGQYTNQRKQASIEPSDSKNNRKAETGSRRAKKGTISAA